MACGPGGNMRPQQKMMILMSGVNIQDTPLVLTCTTTGAQTLTLQGMTVAAGKTVVADWGDGNTDTYTAGAGVRTHAYAGAGTWTVKINNRRNITLLDFEDSKIRITINAANPWPIGLTTIYMPAGVLTLNANTTPWPIGLKALTLAGMAAFTLNANTTPWPTLTTLYLENLTGLTWEIKAARPWPTGAVIAIIKGCPGVTCTAWTDNAVRSIQAENAYSQAGVDAFLAAVYANKANFTYATPTLDLLGGSNAAPSGTYQAASPPTTGKEYAYDLVNGSYTPAGPEWTVATA